MREFEFSSALPVWASGCENKMNETLCFTEKFSYCKDAVFKITACNFYRVFLNGEFLGFGPARAAEGYRRTDVYRISGTEESNTLFIEVNAYRGKYPLCGIYAAKPCGHAVQLSARVCGRLRLPRADRRYICGKKRNF